MERHVVVVDVAAAATAAALRCAEAMNGVTNAEM